MSEDEKKAIDMLEKYITEHKFYNIKQSDGLEDNIKILLDLYMQEKERAEELLKDREKSTEEYIHNNPWLYKQLSESYILKLDVDKNYISKENLNETLDSYKYVKIPGMRQVIDEIEKKVLKED